MEEIFTMLLRDFGQYGVVIALLGGFAYMSFKIREEQSRKFIDALTEERDEWKDMAMENSQKLYESQAKFNTIVEEYVKRNEDIKTILHLVTSLQSLSSAKMEDRKE